jgi:hypothetical protein
MAVKYYIWGLLLFFDKWAEVVIFVLKFMISGQYRIRKEDTE